MKLEYKLSSSSRREGNWGSSNSIDREADTAKGLSAIEKIMLNKLRKEEGIKLCNIRKMKLGSDGMLVILMNELYGSWGGMKRDLRNRQKGKPYIFNLGIKINSDIERINELEQYEKDNKTDLYKLIPNKLK